MSGDVTEAGAPTGSTGPDTFPDDKFFTSDGSEPKFPRPSLSALILRLIAEGEAFLRAEIKLYMARATQKAISAGYIVGLVVGAIMLLQALMVVILIGIVMTISPKFGIGWAVTIVAFVTLVLIVGCLLFARARVSAFLKPEDAL